MFKFWILLKSAHLINSIALRDKHSPSNALTYYSLCTSTGCDIPDIDDGYIVPFDDVSFGAQANVTCDSGFTADNSNITCLTSGHWENATCTRTGIIIICIYIINLWYWI